MSRESDVRLAARQRAEEIWAARDALVQEIRTKARDDEAAKTAKLRALRMLKEAAERASRAPAKVRKKRDASGRV